MTDHNLFEADIDPDDLLAVLKLTGVQVADDATARAFLDGFLAGYGCVIQCIREIADEQDGRVAGKVLQATADHFNEVEAAVLSVARKHMSRRLKVA